MDEAALRARIVDERERTRIQLEDLTREFGAIVDASRDSAADDEHDPDGATVGFERAQVAALVAMTRERLAAFDAALARIDTGEFGVCAACGAKIDPARLVALPASTHCVQCAPAPRRAPR